MVGTFQPLVENQKIVDDNGKPTQYFIRFIQQKQEDIGTAITEAEAEIIAQGLIDSWASARDINTGFGLSGGGDLSADRTLALGNPALTDPGADRILFWDDSTGQMDWLTAGSGLTITDKTLAASGSVTSVGASAPITSTGGATPTIGITAATAGADGSMSAADKSKLDGIQAGATANASDGFLLDRANHTGTQLASTISDFSEATDDRVAGLLVAGANISITYNDGSNTLTIANTAATTSKFPLVDGSTPPNLVYEEDGSLIYVEI